MTLVNLQEADICVQNPQPTTSVCMNRMGTQNMLPAPFAGAQLRMMQEQACCFCLGGGRGFMAKLAKHV